MKIWDDWGDWWELNIYKGVRAARQNGVNGIYLDNSRRVNIFHMYGCDFFGLLRHITLTPGMYAIEMKSWGRGFAITEPGYLSQDQKHPHHFLHHIDFPSQRNMFVNFLGGHAGLAGGFISPESNPYHARITPACIFTYLYRHVDTYLGVQCGLAVQKANLARILIPGAWWQEVQSHHPVWWQEVDPNHPPGNLRTYIWDRGWLHEGF